MLNGTLFHEASHVIASGIAAAFVLQLCRLREDLRTACHETGKKVGVLRGLVGSLSSR